MINLEELEKKLPNGAFSTYDLEVLVPEVQKLKAGDIFVEIGVDKGKSITAVRLVADKDVIVWGCDRKPKPEDLIEGIHYFEGYSFEFSCDWKQVAHTGKISLIHIDGDHCYEGCKGDIEVWLPHMKKDGVMVFHDCDESSVGVMRAVTEFVDTHKCKSFQLFKKTDKNTSMAKVEL